MKTIFPFIISIVLFIGCSKSNPIETEEVALDGFNEVILNSSYDVYLEEGNEFSIRIEADEDVLDHISYTVVDSILYIENDQKFKWLHPTKNKVKVFITSQPLKTVTAHETCFVRTINPITSDEFGMIFLSKANNADLELNCNIFYYWNTHPCGGTLKLNGVANMLKVWNVAIVDVDAKDLVANHAIISNNSKGACIVNVTGYLDYVILGEGNIEVYGNPANLSEMETSTGTGELIFH